MSSIWIFKQEGMSEVHFHASGLSKIVIQAIWLVPKLYFQVFGWSREHFPDVLFIQILFLMIIYWLLYKVDYLQMWSLYSSFSKY